MTMFLTPSSRPRFTTARISSGCTRPVASTWFSRAMIFRIASISGDTWPLGATVRPTASGLDSVFTCLSASKVGSQATLPRLPRLAVDAVHPLDGVRVDAADRPVEDNAAKHFDAARPASLSARRRAA